MSDLQFDEATHTYRYGGIVVPNVTRVLGGLVDYSKIPADTLETARQKGVAVHKMVELDAKGNLDESTLPDWLRPVLDRWRQFIADTGFRVIESEHRVYHGSYHYAGTLDLVGDFWGGPMAFIDVKRSLMGGHVIGLQLAAYQQAYQFECKEIDTVKKIANARRYALRLNENGPYRLEPYTDKWDFPRFLACLSYYRLQEQIR